MKQSFTFHQPLIKSDSKRKSQITKILIFSFLLGTILLTGIRLKEISADFIKVPTRLHTELKTTKPISTESNQASNTVSQHENNMLPPSTDSIHTVPEGSYIIDMGIKPQTVGNGLKPYGLLFALLDQYRVPVRWAVRSGKGKDEVDFTYEGKDFAGGPFIIESGFRTPVVDSVITAWEAMGVVGITTTSEVDIPLAFTIKYSLTWTLDRQTGGLVAKYFEAAGIPETAYNFKLPSDISACEDVFVMPHADPTWEVHGNLLNWNAPLDEGGQKGSIWVNCHAVSVLENVYNPADPSERMNFLMMDPLTPGGEAAIDFGDHDNGSLPPSYLYDHHDDIMMQFVGNLDDATTNGSEQIYLPKVGWRPSTNIAIWDDDHPEVPSLSPGPAAVFAFGRAFGDEDRGLVFYQGGHSLSGSAAPNVAAQRALLNFSFRAAAEKSIDIETNIVSSGNIRTDETAEFTSIVDGFAEDIEYEWSSNCGGTFTNPYGKTTTFIPPAVALPTECIITCVVYAAGCPGRQGFASTPITIIPEPAPPVAIEDVTSTSPETPVTIDALENDYDINLDPLTFTPISNLNTGNGTFINLGNGSIIYASIPNFVGFDTLHYEICDTTKAIDGGPFCDTAAVIVEVNYFDENGCFPSQTFRTLYTGHAVSFDDNGEVDNADNAVGIPDNNFASLNKSDDSENRGILTLNLSYIVPQGDTVFLTISGEDGNTANVRVLGSLGGSTYTDGSIISVTGNTFQSIGYVVNQVAGIDYLQFEMYDNQKKIRLDAVSYAVKTCVDNCNLPFVGITLDGFGDSFDGTSSAANPIRATGTPDQDGAEVDGANSEFLIIDLTDTIPTGGYLELFLADNGDRATFQVSGSFDNTSYSDVQLFTTTVEKDNFSQFIYNVNQTGGIRYLRFEITNGVKGYVDGISYDFFACVDGTPVAANDQDFTQWNTPTTWDVLANDFEPQGESMTVSILSGPDNGIASVNIDGTITYTSDFGFTGNDTITYTACDPIGLCDEAIFVITVIPGCSMGEVLTETVNGYGLDVFSSSLVGNPTNGLGIPDDESAELDDAGGELVLQLNQNVSPGDTIWIQLSGQDGNPAPTTVEGSADGMNFTNLVTYTPSGTIFSAYPYRVADVVGVEYLRISNNNNSKKSRVDGVVYQGTACLASCVLPTVQIEHSGQADNFDGSSTAANPTKATGIPDFDGAEIDGGDSDFLILDLTEIIPQGFSIYFYLADDGTPANVEVTSSLSTTGFLDAQSFAPTSEKDVYAQFKYDVTQAGGVRYLRFEETLGEVALVDGVDYVYFICENGKPLAVNDFKETAEDVATNVNVLANDADPQGDDLTVSILALPSNGNAAIELDGTITYYPNTDFSGLDTITYVICDPTPLCDTAILEINVLSDACAATERFSLVAGFATTVTTDVNVANETDALSIPDQTYAALDDNGDELVLELSDIVLSGYDITLYVANNTGTTATGTIEGSPDNMNWNDLTVISAPTEAPNGQDTLVFTPTNSTRYLRFKLTTEELLIDAAVYSDYFGPCEPISTNQAPIAKMDSLFTGLNSSITYDVTQNDFEPDFGPISEVSLLSSDMPSNGTVTITGNEITYTPNKDFVGVDTFSYYLCDNYAPVACDTALVIVETLCVDPAGENAIQGTTFNDMDIDAMHGISEAARTGISIILYDDVDLSNTVSIGDTPLDTTISDANGNFYFNTMAPDAVNTILEVIPGNADDAVETVICNGCVNTVGTVIEDDSKLNFGGDPTNFNGEQVVIGLRFSGVNVPAGAVVQSATIDFTAFPDGGVNTSPTTLTIYGESIDDAPTFDEGTDFDISSRTKTSNFITWINVLQWDLDNVYKTPDLLTVVQEIVNNGSWSSGNDLAFIIEGEGLRQAYSRDEDGNKAPRLNITYSVPGTINYVMEVDTNSISFFDSVTTINNVQTANFTLNGEVACNTDFGIYERPNLAPVVVNDSIIVPSNSIVAIPVQDNDFDPEDGIIVMLLDNSNQPKNGTIATKQDSILYEPYPNFTGLDTFSYLLCDFGTPSLCDTAQVFITVANEAPNAMDDIASAESEILTIFNVLGNDSDRESPNGQLSFQLIGTVTNGSALFYPDGSLAYTSNSGYDGPEVIQYAICDDDSPIKCDTASLTITVDPLMNAAPIATDDYDTTTLNLQIFVSVKDNDFDEENDPLTISVNPSLLQPMHGTISILPNGLIQYIPDANYVGDDSFEYQVCDNGVPPLCDIATAFIYVDNQEPYAYDDMEQTSMDSSVSIIVLTNDVDPDLDILELVSSGTDASDNSTNQGGTTSVNNNGTPNNYGDDFIDYTSPAGYIGLDSFLYVVCDTASIPACDTALVVVEVTPPIDLEVTKMVSPATVNIGDTVTFSITVTNTGDAIATNILLKDYFPTSYQNIGNNQNGAYDPDSGIWYIDSLSDGGGTKTLAIQAIVLDFDEVNNIVQVTRADQVDLDSSPNNDDGDQSEDDEANAAVMVEVTTLKISVLLQGALLGNNDTLMRDDLRKQNLIPLSQPYVDSLNIPAFQHLLGGNETTTPAILTTPTDTSNSIVDWVFIELRNGADTVTIERTIAALVQRDGDVVAAMTGNNLEFSSLPDSFYLAVKHRNHLGVMTAHPLKPTNGDYNVDFRNINAADVYHFGSYHDLEMVTMNGKQALWAGNALVDKKSKYDGASNDRSKVGAEVILHGDNSSNILNFNGGIGYYFGDLNMDGKAKYDGVNNDRLWLQNIIITYPMNFDGLRLNNFDLMLQQLP